MGAEGNRQASAPPGSRPRDAEMLGDESREGLGFPKPN